MVTRIYGWKVIALHLLLPLEITAIVFSGIFEMQCKPIYWTKRSKQNHVLCSLSLLSAAIAVATDGGKCLRFVFVLWFSSLSGIVSGALDSKASTSFRVKTGWSWFLVLPLMNEWLLLLLFNLYILSSTVSFTYNTSKNKIIRTDYWIHKRSPKYHNSSNADDTWDRRCNDTTKKSEHWKQLNKEYGLLKYTFKDISC